MKRLLLIPLVFIILICFTNTIKAQEENTLYFTKNVDYVKTAYIPADGSFSYSAWVLIDNTSYENMILGTCTEEWNGYWLEFYNGKIRFFNDGSYIGSIPVPENKWIHVAITYDGTNLKSYVNGQLDISSTTTISNTGDSLFIGRIGRYNHTSSMFGGKMDNLTLWNIARTQEEIQDEIVNGLSGTEDGLISLYKFNQGAAGGDNTSITTLTDSKGNYNGTLYGFTLNSSTSNFVESSITTNENILDFDGTDDYIYTNYTPSGTYTYAAWIKVVDGIYENMILGTCNSNSTWPGYWLEIDDNKVRQFSGTEKYGTINIADDTWYHIAVTYDGINVKTYVNGELDIDVVKNSDNTGTELYIGAIGSLLYGSTSFNGKMDNISVWNEARNQEEIINEMLFGLKGNETGLVAYYKFNQGIQGGDNTGLYIAIDQTGKNHGYLSNFEFLSTTSNFIAQEISAPLISGQPNSVSITVGNDATFNVTATNVITYQWQKFDGYNFEDISDVSNYSGTQTNTLTVSNATLDDNNTIFRCILTNANMGVYSNSATLLVSQTSGISNSKANQINIYPTPTNGLITIETNDNNYKEVQIINSNGQIVKSISGNEDKITTDLTNNPAGIYFVKIISNTTNQSFKIIKK